MTMADNIISFSSTQLDRAIKEWSDVVGAEHVLVGQKTQSYNNCTSHINRDIPAVIRPDRVDEIQKIVKIAGQYNVRLSPISTGKNWGFGGAVSPDDHVCILDLSRMNRILDFIPDLGIITIEPGVTQGQLAEFLSSGNYPFSISCSSSSPNCSVMGNLLDRGHGLMPYTDRFAAMTSLKAVLPDGSLYQSLIADGGCDEIDKVYKWGVGPYLDGLFSQSGFGVVTQISLMLAPRAEQTTLFMFRPKPGTAIDELMVKLRRVKHECGHLISTFELGTRTNAHDHMFTTHELTLDGWSVMGGLHASRDMSKFVIKKIKRDLRNVCTDFIFFNDDTIPSYRRKPIFNRKSTLRRYVHENWQLLTDMLGFMKGTPQSAAMMYAYHRMPDVLNGDQSLKSMEDHLRDIGLMWYWPLLPARGSDIRLFLSMMNRVSDKHGFKPVWNFNLEHSTYISAGVHIFYDPKTEQDRVMAYYRDLFAEGKALGYMPHRPHIDSGSYYAGPEASHAWALTKKLKSGIDPNNTFPMRVPLS